MTTISRLIGFFTVYIFLFSASAFTSQSSSVAPSSTGIVAAVGGPPVVVSQDKIQVDINVPKPHSHGLSHNQYTRFDVDQRGVVLNNNHSIPAHIILNEVIGAHASHLQGTIAVAGQRADVIIANPNGIHCHGCGFYNVHHGVLTTGVPSFFDGRLSGFNVNQGRITIGAEGLVGYHAANIDPAHIALIATGVDIHGKIYAKQNGLNATSTALNNLQIITGKNTLALTQETQSASLIKDMSVSQTFSQDSAEGAAIDVGNLGGMYAKKIHLISTTQGIGVHSAGVIHAADNLTIQASTVVNKSSGAMMSTAGDITVHVGKQFDNEGTFYAKKNLELLNSNQQHGHTTAFTNHPGAMIYAKNTLQLGHDCQLDSSDICTRSDWQSLSSQVVVNNHGTLLSDANTYIQANTFHNSVKDASTQEINFFWDKGEVYTQLIPGEVNVNWNYVPDTKGKRKKYWMKSWLYETRYTQPDFLIHRPSIIAGKKLSIRLQDGENKGGTLAAAHTVHLQPLRDAGTPSALINKALIRYLNVKKQTVMESYRCLGIICPTRPNGTERRYVDQLGELILSDSMVLESVGGIIQGGLWGQGVKIDVDNFINQGAVENYFNETLLSTAARHSIKNNLSKGEKNTDFFAHYLLPTRFDGPFIKTDGIDTPLVATLGYKEATELPLLSSDFLLDAIAQRTEDAAEKARLRALPRLGDGDYETYLVHKQVLAKTGLAWLDPLYTDHQTQFKQLMNNALDVPDLKIGTALTEAQQHALKKNIVWLVEKRMADKTVLVPQLYLSSSAAENKQGGSVLGKNVQMTLSSLENRGGEIRAENQLEITTKKSLSNLSGELKGDNVTFKTPRLIHQTLFQRYGDADNYTEMAHRHALIYAKQDVLVEGLKSTGPENKIDLIGSTIDSENGRVHLNSDSDISVRSLVLEKKTTQWPPQDDILARYIEQHIVRADISSTQEIKMNALRNIDLQGVALRSPYLSIESQQGNVDLRALALIQASQIHKKSRSGSFFSSQETSNWDTRIHIAHANTDIFFGDYVEILAKHGWIQLGDTDFISMKAKGNTASVLKLSAQSVSTLPTQDVDYFQKKSYDSFLGIRFEGHSSVVNAVEHAHKALGAQGSGQAYVRATVMRGAQMAGDVSNIAFNDTVGASLNFSKESRKKITDYQMKSDLVSTWSADKIFVNATKGDIFLSGINLASEKSDGLIDFRALGNITIHEAEDATEWRTHSQDQQFTLGGAISANVLMASAGAGLRLGYQGGKGYTASTNTRHTPAHIMANQVNFDSGKDTVLQGGKVIGKKITFNTRGSLKVESTQDTEVSDTREGSWGGTFGVDVNATTFLGVNGGLNGRLGKNWQRSALTSEQSGFFAESMRGIIDGDVKLSGAHLIATQQLATDRLWIKGRVDANSLIDLSDKDGFVVGGGVGVGVDGRPSGSFDFSTPKMMKYRATQQSTMAGLLWNADGGVIGSLNTDASQLMKLEQKDSIEAIEVSGTFAFTAKAKKSEEENLPLSPKNKINRLCCFAPGTLVSTPSGERAIEDLRVGDIVWSRDDKGHHGTIFPARITQTHQRDDQPIYKLVLEQGNQENSPQQEILLVTPGHPFYVVGRGFVAASQLKKGDILAGRKDASSSTQVVSFTLHRERGHTHNLTVDLGHTFFVGALGTWVHNTGDCINTAWFVSQAKKNADVVKKEISDATIYISDARENLFDLQKHVEQANEALRQKNNQQYADQAKKFDDIANRHIDAALALQEELVKKESTLLDTVVRIQNATASAIEQSTVMHKNMPTASKNLHAKKHLTEVKEYADTTKKHAQLFEELINEADFSGRAQISLNSLVGKGVKYSDGKPDLSAHTAAKNTPLVSGIPIVKVDEKTFELLAIADEINKKVRKDLPLGAGNQKDDVIDSQGLSTLRTHVMRQFLNKKGSIISRQRFLDSAKSACAGNCGEHAELAYQHLIASYGDQFHIQMVKARNQDHVFVTLEEKNNTLSKNIVVIDPWSIDGGAHLLVDHAFYVGEVIADNLGVNPLRMAKLSKRRASFKQVEDEFEAWMLSINKKFPNILEEQIEDAKNAIPGHFSPDNGIWNQRLTMDGKVVYQLEGSDQIFVPFLPDPQRAQRMQIKMNSLKIGNQ